MARDQRGVIVRVDHDICIGNAMCRAAAPKAFAIGDNGQAVVAEPEAEALTSLLEAAALCPVGAIEVEDAETGQPLEPPR